MIAIIIALVISVALLGFSGEITPSYNETYFTKEDVEEFWNIGKAALVNLDECEEKYTIATSGYYEMTGSLDGQIFVQASSDSVVFIRLNGVNISNDAGPCIFVENADKVVLELSEGSENYLYMGQESTDEKADGVIYAKDDLTINGKGSLEVVGEYSHGIVCNDSLALSGGTIKVTAKDDGIHANDLIAVREANINISAGDDGITVKNDKNNGVFYGESGYISIDSCYEGVEGDAVYIDGGEYIICPMDDGINGMNLVEINGGDIRIENQGGNDVDGIDSNKDVVISGGNIYISLPQGNMNMPIDYGEESGGSLTITGGEITALVGGTEVDVTQSTNPGMKGGGPGGDFKEKFDGDFEGPEGEPGEKPDGEFRGKPGGKPGGNMSVPGGKDSSGKDNKNGQESDEVDKPADGVDEH